MDFNEKVAHGDVTETELADVQSDAVPSRSTTDPVSVLETSYVSSRGVSRKAPVWLGEWQYNGKKSTIGKINKYNNALLVDSQ